MIAILYRLLPVCREAALRAALASLCLLALNGPPSVQAYSGPIPDSLVRLSSGYAVVVDKSLQRLFVFQATGKGFDKVFDAPCATGKTKGQKLVKGDAKTPNGIYFATRYVRMTNTNTTYGSTVFHLDYPNLFDKRAGRNGDNIWIHGTNKPLQPYTSNGCVALRNADIENLARYIFLGKTPVIIADAVQWVHQGGRHPDRDALERIPALWSRAVIHGDAKAQQALYLPDGDAPKSQRKALAANAGQLKTADYHLDLTPRDISLFRLDNTAVVVFDQVFSVRSSDNIQSRYVRLYLEKTGNRWHATDSERPVPSRVRETMLLVQREAEAARRPAAAAVAAATPAPRPEATAAAPSAGSAEVGAFVGKWAKAWEAGRMEAYRASYASSFRHKKMNLDEYVAYKKDLHKRYKNIRVRVENLRVSVTGDKATAVFRQKYSASNMSASGTKRLELVKVRGDWKIAKELMN